MADDQDPGNQRPLAHSLGEVRDLHQLCREGRLYDVDRWITEGKPLQISPQALPKRVHPKTALEIALETGQHSLTALLLSRGYRQELERYRPLELALRTRRWDLFDLLLEWGGDHLGLDDLLFRRHGPRSFREGEDSTGLSD